MEWLGAAWHVPFQRIYWSVIYQFCIQWVQSFDFCYVAIQCHNASYYIAYKCWSIMVIRLNKQRDTIRWITISRYAFYHIIMQKFIALPSMSIPQTVQIHCSMRGSGKREGHDDVIKWKHFPRYWPLVRVIHRWPGNSPHKGQWRGALMFSLVCAWKKTIEETIVRLVIWDAIAHIMTSLFGVLLKLTVHAWTDPRQNICVTVLYSNLNIKSWLFWNVY